MVMTAERPKTSKKAIMQRSIATKHEVADMYVKGCSQFVIADKMKLTQGRVSQILTGLRMEWKAAQLVDTNEKLLIELAKMDKLEQEAWGAWDKSKENGVTVLSRRVKPRQEKDKDGKPVKGKAPAEGLLLIGEEETRVGQCGDPAYLNIIEKCIVTRLKLMGLLNPKDAGGVQNTQININWGDLAKPIHNVEVINVTPSKSIEDRIAAESLLIR